jgi:hypothetical protein
MSSISRSRARAVGSFEDCADLAKEVGEGITSRGWMTCIAKVLEPLVPERFVLDGDEIRRRDFLGVEVEGDGALRMHFRYRGRVAVLALDEVPLSPPDDATVSLWVASYVRWRKELLATHGMSSE